MKKGSQLESKHPACIPRLAQGMEQTITKLVFVLIFVKVGLEI